MALVSKLSVGLFSILFRELVSSPFVSVTDCESFCLRSPFSLPILFCSSEFDLSLMEVGKPIFVSSSPYFVRKMNIFKFSVTLRTLILFCHY